jgi:hypothetical protein
MINDCMIMFLMSLYHRIDFLFVLYLGFFVKVVLAFLDVFLLLCMRVGLRFFRD